MPIAKQLRPKLCWCHVPSWHWCTTLKLWRTGEWCVAVGWSLKLKVVMASPSRGICYLIPPTTNPLYTCYPWLPWYFMISLYRGSLNHLQIPISISVFRQWEQRLSGPGGGGLLTTQNNHLDSIKRGKGDSDSLDQAIDLSICTQSAMTPSTKVATHLPLLLEVRTAIHIRISIDSYLGKYRKDNVPWIMKHVFPHSGTCWMKIWVSQVRTNMP